MTGVLAQLPDSAVVARLSATATAAVDVSASSYESLSGDDPTSPLAPLLEAVEAVAGQAAVDVAGVADDLAATLQDLSTGLPPGVIEFVTSLEEAYDHAREYVTGHPLSVLVPQGESLRDVGAGLLDAAVDSFRQQVTELVGQALDSDALREVTELLELMERLRADLPGNVDELAGFVTTALIGFRPAALQPLRGHVGATLEVVAQLDAAALAAVLDPLRAAAEQALSGLDASVDAFDPTVAAGYDEVVAALDAIAATVTQAATALTPLYDAVAQRVAAHGWQRVVPAYLDLLRAVDLAPGQLVDAVVDVTTEVLEDLTARAQAAVDADELVARVEGFAAGLHTAIAQSAVGELRGRLEAAIGDVRDAVAAVPLEDVRQAVVDLVGRVGEQLERLDLDGVAGQLEQAFDDLEALVVRLAGEAGAAVREGVDAIGDALESLPVDDLVAALQQALAQVGSVIGAARNGVAAHLDDLRAQLVALEELSFRPAGDVVVGEIDEIRGRLEKMSPNALSTAEQLAVRAAIGLYEALDVEGTVVREATEAFHALQQQVLVILDEVQAAVERLRRVFAELDPQRLLRPVSDAFDDVDAVLGRLNAASLLAPARITVARVEEQLGQIAPGSLLDPLQGSYGKVVAAVAALDPARWGAALEDLHAELAALVDRVDLGPLFAELDERRRDLLATTREALSQGLQELGLPPPVDAWFATVRLLLEEVTDILFLDPGEGMRQLGERVASELAPSSLYEPLESAFEEVLSTLEQLPTGPLVEAATEVRDGLVDVLDLLEPDRLVARLREAHRRLVEAGPATVLVTLPQLTGLRAAFQAKVDAAVSVPTGQVARVSARFDAVTALSDPQRPPSPVAGLQRTQDAALAVLREAVDGLDAGAAQAEWQRVRDQLDALIPAVLLEPGPLTAARVVAACETWRPSARAAPLDGRLQAFLDTLAPLAERLDGAFDQFAADLRATAELLDPLALDRALLEVVDAVRAQVDALAPGPVLEALRNEIWAPVSLAVAALDPAQLAARVDVVYARARGAVTDQLAVLLDDVEQLLAQHLQRARAAVAAVTGDVEQALDDAAAAVTALVREVDDLVFVEVLGRLRKVIENLGTSFDAEVGRVVAAFNAMLAAAPVGQRSQVAGAAT